MLSVLNNLLDDLFTFIFVVTHLLFACCFLMFNMNRHNMNNNINYI